jgi:hypothetical protein
MVAYACLFGAMAIAGFVYGEEIVRRLGLGAQLDRLRKHLDL